MRGVIKKPSVYVPREKASVLGKLSKQALLDIAWNLALLGTDESEEQVFTKVAREAVIVCEGRGDALPSGLKEASARVIDSDPEAS